MNKYNNISYNFYNKYCTVNINIKQENLISKVQLNGIILDDVDDNIIKYVAASPVTHNTSFSGSGMPYPNEKVAFTNTPNKGLQKLKLNKFNINILMPNSYCKDLCNKIVEPTIYIKYNSNNETVILNIPVGNKIPYRNHTFNDKRKDPLFYENNLEILTQEEILLNSSYPNNNNYYNNHWGYKPAK